MDKEQINEKLKAIEQARNILCENLSDVTQMDKQWHKEYIESAGHLQNCKNLLQMEKKE